MKVAVNGGEPERMVFQREEGIAGQAKSCSSEGGGEGHAG